MSLVPPLQSPVLSGISGKVNQVWNRFFIDLSNFVNSGATAAWPVGSVMSYLGTTSPSGWLLISEGTIGDSLSGATLVASSSVSNLYLFYWNNLDNTAAPVSGGRGVSAIADFRSHKALLIPLQNGRIMAADGTGTGLISKSLGLVEGVEEHILTEAESPLRSHYHRDEDPSDSNNTHKHTDFEYCHTNFNSAAADPTGGVRHARGSTLGAGQVFPINNNPPNTSTVAAHSTGNSIGSQASEAHNNIGPSVFYPAIVKL